MSDDAASIPRSIRRLLRAAYAGHHRLSNEVALRQFAHTAKARAFPQFTIELEFIFLKSRRRSCLKTTEAGKAFIVIDQGEAALLTIEDAILRRKSFEPEDSLALLQLPFAEAFRRNDEWERALICILRCLAHAPRLQALQSEMANAPGYSSVSLFLLLHELAHLAVDTNEPFTLPLVQQVRDSLDAHCEANDRLGNLIERGGTLPAFVDTSAKDQTPEERSVLARQIKDHVALVRNSPEIVREAGCDYLAAVGMLNWRSGIDSLTAESPAVDGVARREIGDILMLGLRVSRLLMIHHFLELTAHNIAEDLDPSLLTKAFAEMTARHNVSVNLALDRFEKIMTIWRFSGPADAVDYIGAFRRDIEVLNARSDQRLLRYVEEVGFDHRDLDRHSRDVAEIRREFFEGAPPDRARLEEVLERELAKLPL